MLRSMFSGITGLRAHQQMMDVVGNNIANVNTAGYKAQNAVFETVISQAVKSPAAPVAPSRIKAARTGFRSDSALPSVECRRTSIKVLPS